MNSHKLCQVFLITCGLLFNSGVFADSSVNALDYEDTTKPGKKPLIKTEKLESGAETQGDRYRHEQSQRFPQRQQANETWREVEDRRTTELKRGQRIDRRLDRKGARIDQHLDRGAEQAASNGNNRKAERLDRKGDRIERRLDRRGDRIAQKAEKKRLKKMEKQLKQQKEQENEKVNYRR